MSWKNVARASTFLYPLRTSENFCLSNVFMGYRQNQLSCHFLRHCKLAWKIGATPSSVGNSLQDCRDDWHESTYFHWSDLALWARASCSLGVISTPDPPENEVFLRPDNRLLSSNVKQKFIFKQITIWVITLLILIDLSHCSVKEKTVEKYFSKDQLPICDTFYENTQMSGLLLRKKLSPVTTDNKHHYFTKTTTKQSRV